MALPTLQKAIREESDLPGPGADTLPPPGTTRSEACLAASWMGLGKELEHGPSWR